MPQRDDVLDRPRYDEDYYAWALDQAKRLRELAAIRPNEPIDWELLAEEVEDLGTSERHAVVRQIRRIIEHFLKLEHSQQTEPRRQWSVSVVNARDEVAQHLTPSIRREVAAALPDLYVRERRSTARKLALYDEPDVATRLPAECPYSFDQLLDEDWWPPGSGIG